MKEETVYICEICGNECSRKEEALRCENSHCKPKEIIDFMYKYRSEVPACIKVKMSNGKIVEYRN